MTCRLALVRPKDTAIPDLPREFAGLILAFAPLFVHRSRRHARISLLGASLAPGRRTVASLLRIMGRAHEHRFIIFYRILNYAAWSPDPGDRILLGHLTTPLAPRGAMVQDLDATIERHLGKRIKACRIARDWLPHRTPVAPREAWWPVARLRLSRGEYLGASSTQFWCKAPLAVSARS